MIASGVDSQCFPGLAKLPAQVTRAHKLIMMAVNMSEHLLLSVRKVTLSTKPGSLAMLICRSKHHGRNFRLSLSLTLHQI